MGGGLSLVPSNVAIDYKSKERERILGLHGSCTPEIEPTNNAVERGLRKFVVMEKIMGCLRSEQGKETLQVLLSLCGTWRLRGLNPYRELRAIL